MSKKSFTHVQLWVRHVTIKGLNSLCISLDFEWTWTNYHGENDESFNE
jgi:hypothetical protein